jgi:hypothetical protein
MVGCEDWDETERFRIPNRYEWKQKNKNLALLTPGCVSEIDYFFVHNTFLDKVESCNMMTNQLGSDHCPIFLELKGVEISKTTKSPSLSSNKIRPVRLYQLCTHLLLVGNTNSPFRNNKSYPAFLVLQSQQLLKPKLQRQPQT